MNELERAAASWFGMDPDKVSTGMITSSTKGLALQVVIPITADDYLGIADRMRVMREPAATMFKDDTGEWRTAPPEPQSNWTSPVTATAIAKKHMPL